MISEVILQKLNLEFEKRKKLNSRYSLRAYSRDLDIPASILCRIRSRTLTLSDNLKTKLKAKLFKDNDEYNLFFSECLSSPDLIYPSKKLSQKDFYFFRLWYLWLQTHLSKQPDSQELQFIAEQNKLDINELTILINYFKNIRNNKSNGDYSDQLPFLLFKNISQDFFEERFINFLYKIPDNYINETKPFVSQKSFPLAINKEIAEQIQDKINNLSAGCNPFFS